MFKDFDVTKLSKKVQQHIAVLERDIGDLQTAAASRDAGETCIEVRLGIHNDPRNFHIDNYSDVRFTPEGANYWIDVRYHNGKVEVYSSSQLTLRFSGSNVCQVSAER